MIHLALAVQNAPGSAGRVSEKSNRRQGNAVGEEPEHEPLRHREAPVAPPGAPCRPVASLRAVHATLGLSRFVSAACRHPEMACLVCLLRVALAFTLRAM